MREYQRVYHAAYYEKHRDKQLEYVRTWKANNPERVREYQRTRGARERDPERHRNYLARNRDQINARGRARQKNRDAILAALKESGLSGTYSQKRQLSVNKLELRRGYSRKYRVQNREKIQDYLQRTKDRRNLREQKRRAILMAAKEMGLIEGIEHHVD